MSGDRGKSEFMDRVDVSRETLGRLETFVDILEDRAQKMNLVSRSTLKDVWTRHVLDSAQLVPLIRKHQKKKQPVLVDVGSGAGLPGLVIALMTGWPVTLVEKSRKKCGFLEAALRATETHARIWTGRVEAWPFEAPDCITARAFAPLPRLLDQTEKLHAPGTQFWLLKGQHVDKELTEATISWNMSVERFSSLSDPGGTIVCLERLDRKLA